MPATYRVSKLQAGIFVSGIQFGSVGKTNIKLRGLLKPLEMNPMPLQIPSEAPGEIPRFILLSSDGTWQLTASLQRVDFQAVSQGMANLEALPEDTQEQFWNVAGDKLCSFLAGFETDATRLLVTAEYIADRTDQLPIDFVRGRLFSQHLPAELGDDLEDAEFHSHRIEQITLAGKSVKINQWVRLKAAHAIKDSGPLLTAEMDVNTVSQPSGVEFDSTAIREFVTFAKTKFSSLLTTVSAI